jgi:hypothetical protein
MINSELVLASIMVFVMSGVAATTMVTQETYAENKTTTEGTCEPGWHLVPGNHTGKMCESDNYPKEGSLEWRMYTDKESPHPSPGHNPCIATRTGLLCTR